MESQNVLPSSTNDEKPNNETPIVIKNDDISDKSGKNEEKDIKIDDNIEGMVLSENKEDKDIIIKDKNESKLDNAMSDVSNLLIGHEKTNTIPKEENEEMNENKKENTSEEVLPEKKTDIVKIELPSSQIDPSKENEDLTDKQLEDMLDQVVNRFVCPPVHYRNPLKKLINRKRVSAIVSGDYETAEQQEKAINALNYVLNMEQERLHEDNRMDILYDRYQQLQLEHQKLNEAWDAKIETFMAADTKRLDELKQKHLMELEEFNLKWRDPVFLRHYNKPSAKLLQLREMEKARAVSRLYSKAKEMKYVADKVQKEETTMAQQKIAAQMQFEKKRLVEKHDKELKRHEEHRILAVQNMNVEREQSMRHILSAMQQIKAKKGNISTKVATPTSPHETAENGESPLSPRTQKLYAHFRSEKRKTRLEVTPVDETLVTASVKSRTTITRPLSGYKKKGKFNQRQ